MAVRRVVNVAVSIFVSGFAVCTAGQLASFLSWSSSNNAAIQVYRSPLMCVLWDVGLALQFCFQHSVLCWPRVCSAMDHNCGALSRSAYLMTSCLSLKLLMLLWLPLDSHILWAIKEGSPLSWTLATIHIVCWASIYIGCIITDLGELAGIKQPALLLQLHSGRRLRPLSSSMSQNEPAGADVINHAPSQAAPPVFVTGHQGEPPTFAGLRGEEVWSGAESSTYNSSRSLQLEHFLQHMRHPSLVALSVILWFYPIMTLDRAVLALIFTIYPFGWFKTQVEDYKYCHCFWRSKLVGLLPKALS
ncbi:nurim homolog [Rhipicephalus microplus]|uniref:nurim homolog n=1 Tax=Rhipicephalus microplus TaxID=6941 RepID=UPI003F6A5A50